MATPRRGRGDTFACWPLNLEGERGDVRLLAAEPTNQRGRMRQAARHKALIQAPTGMFRLALEHSVA